MIQGLHRCESSRTISQIIQTFLVKLNYHSSCTPEVFCIHEKEHLGYMQPSKMNSQID